MNNFDPSPHDTTSYPGLHAWNDPQNALADIIFVHRVPGHPRKSFSYSDDDETFWPLWLLEDGGQHRQHLRIWTFGFASERRDGTILVSHIEDYGETLYTLLKQKLKNHVSTLDSPVSLVEDAQLTKFCRIISSSLLTLLEG